MLRPNIRKRKPRVFRLRVRKRVLRLRRSVVHMDWQAKQFNMLLAGFSSSHPMRKRVVELLASKYNTARKKGLRIGLAKQFLKAYREYYEDITGRPYWVGGNFGNSNQYAKMSEAAVACATFGWNPKSYISYVRDNMNGLKLSFPPLGMLASPHYVNSYAEQHSDGGGTERISGDVSRRIRVNELPKLLLRQFGREYSVGELAHIESVAATTLWYSEFSSPKPRLSLAKEVKWAIEHVYRRLGYEAYSRLG